MPAQHGVRGQPAAAARGAVLSDHGEQDREQGPVRPVRVQAARLPPLQHGELVAQDQDLLRSATSPRAGTARSHVAIRVTRRKTSRRHMTGDHYGQTAGMATLLVRAVDGILGTHTASGGRECPHLPRSALVPSSGCADLRDLVASGAHRRRRQSGLWPNGIKLMWELASARRRSWSAASAGQSRRACGSCTGRRAAWSCARSGGRAAAGRGCGGR